MQLSTVFVVINKWSTDYKKLSVAAAKLPVQLPI